MNTITNIIIIFSGLAGSGKSSTGEEAAKRLGFGFFSMGYLYRVITYYFMGQEIAPEEATYEHLSYLKVENIKGRIFLNGVDVHDELKKQRISDNVSRYSPLSFIREYSKDILKTITSKGNWILEGRSLQYCFDNVFMYFYFECDAAVRAEREAKARGIKDPAEIVHLVKSLEKRDHDDISRKLEPLEMVTGSIVVNTTNMEPEEQVQMVLDCTGLATKGLRSVSC